MRKEINKNLLLIEIIAILVLTILIVTIGLSIANDFVAEAQPHTISQNDVSHNIDNILPNVSSANELQLAVSQSFEVDPTQIGIATSLNEFFLYYGSIITKSSMGLVDTLVDWISKNKQADHLGDAYNLIKNGAILASLIAAMVATKGNQQDGTNIAALVSTGFDIIDHLISYGTITESELADLQRHLDDQMNYLNTNINTIQTSIVSVGKMIEQNSKLIIDTINNATEALYARQKLSEFYSSSVGNFSYLSLKNYLFGSTNSKDNNNYMEAYYSKLLEISKQALVDKNVPETTIQNAYNDLYTHLMSTSNGDSPVNMYYDYLFGDYMDGKSISNYYYEYLVANNGGTNANIVYNSFFALNEMMQVATCINGCITSCHDYFATKIYEEYGTATYDGYYQYGPNSTDRISLSDIKQYESVIEQRNIELKKRYAKDCAVIFNLGNSYMVRDGWLTRNNNKTEHYDYDELWECVNNKKETFGNILEGQTIYLSNFSDAIYSGMCIDKKDVSFAIYDENRNLIKQIENWVIVDYQELPKNFYVCGVYNHDTIIFTIPFFNKPTEFNGGSGVAGDPYLICNVDQLKNIKMDGGVYYKLMRDLDLTQFSSRFGSKSDMFQGQLDGNYHTLSNYRYIAQSGEVAGLFNYIGVCGCVKNIIINSFNVRAYDKNEINLYAGGIAAVCYGTIANCLATKCKIVATRNVTKSAESKKDEPIDKGLVDEYSDNEKIYEEDVIEEYNTNINKEIFTFSGALAGLSCGTITYCEVGDGSTVTSRSYRKYYANDDIKNKNNVFAGGIVGYVASGTLSYCKADASVHVYGIGKSYCSKQLSTRHPYILICVGGIAGATQVKAIDVCSNANTLAEHKVKNTYIDGGSDNVNVYKNEDLCVACLPGQKNSEIVQPAWPEQCGMKSKHNYKFAYSYGGEKDSSCDNYNVNQIYNYGDVILNCKDLTVSVDGKMVDDYFIVTTWDFNTKNHTKTGRESEAYTGEMSVIISAYIDAVMVYKIITIPYYVKADSPIDLYVDVSHLNKNVFYSDESKYIEYGAYDSKTILSKGEKVILVYRSGEQEDVTSELTSKYYLKKTSTGKVTINDTFEDVGFIEVFVEYGEFKTNSYAYVFCGHVFNTSTIDPTCGHIGYDEYVCDKCGYTYNNNPKSKVSTHANTIIYEHNSVEAIAIKGYKGKINATCTVAGYTGDVYCLDCGQIIAFGEVEAAHGHSYDLENGCNSENHICTICGHEEKHIWVNYEDGAYIITKCGVCGWEASRVDNLGNLPYVVVSSPYALANSRVSVYVQLLNNPGITSASLSIQYDPSLTFIDWNQGELLNNKKLYNFSQDSIDGSHRLYFTMGSTSTITGNGNLLELVFKTSSSSTKKTYNIEVGHTTTTAKFTDKNNKKIEILGFDGLITIVDHLPGDVNNDNVVDIFDAVLISIACNNVGGIYNSKLIAAGCKFETGTNVLIHGDVNFDGYVDNQDLVRVMRSLVGGYNCQLIDDTFVATLIYNDSNATTKDITVTKGKTYDEILGSYNPTKDGYVFNGWYSYSGKKLDDTVVAYFDEEEYTVFSQQLYEARWTQNKIHYITGIEGVEIADVDYASYNSAYPNAEGIYKLNKDLTKKYIIRYFDDSKFDVQEVTLELDGWAIEENGAKVYEPAAEINLKSGNIGYLVLYPVWKDPTIELPYRVEKANRKGKVVTTWKDSDSGVFNSYDAKALYNLNAFNTTYSSTYEAYIIALYVCEIEDILYNIEFDINFDSSWDTAFSSNPISSIVDINYFTEVTIPNLNYYSEKFVFKGWSLSNNTLEVDYLEGSKLQEPDFVIKHGQIVRLYGVWGIPHSLDENCYCSSCKSYVHGEKDGSYCIHDTDDGKIVYFGTYPQTKVNSEDLIEKLNNKAGDLPTAEDSRKWVDYGYYISGSVQSYMWYQDIVYAGGKYRGVYFIKYRPTCIDFYASESSSYQDDNGYATSTVYWFKFEPIKWRVLTESNGKALLLADLVLDSQDYEPVFATEEYLHNGKTGYSNNYELSHIRAWLNDDFYNTAFTKTQQSIIVSTDVDNSVASTGDVSNGYLCVNTCDKIFLLSYSEATNSSYGLDSDSSRQAFGSDYAKAQGLFEVNERGSLWWLRTPYCGAAMQARNVSFDLEITYYNVEMAEEGVRPACWITLS